MTRGTFTIAVAFLCSTAAATEQEVTCESPCECSSAHGKGRWLVKNDPSSPPTDASAIQSVTPSDIFGWPGPDEGVLSRKEAPMALISCPECNSQVSDRAASCPKCGYPLGQEKSFAHLLVDCRWKARSSALAAESLEANFASDGSFEGMLSNPPDDLIIRPQRVTGRWHVAKPLLLLSYPYVTVSGGPAE